MKVTISAGNSKLGKLPNISLTPIKSCRPGVLCSGNCYALRPYNQYPSTRKAWDGNLAAYQENAKEFFGYIRAFLAKKKPAFFRWHVGGEIPDPLYWSWMQRTCSVNPETNFLVFTKYYDLDFSHVPSNLSTILSVWPGMPLPKNTELPRAWMKPKEPVEGYDIPEDALHCPGLCTECGMCFDLRKTGKDIFFPQH